ncbi:MAG: acyl-CoA synthetase FdrA, partial [Enterobacteriaceae bacterium]
ETAQQAFSLVETLLKPQQETEAGQQQALQATSIEMALQSQPQANLALISVPGQYAAAETLKALRLGLNVMLFSDNVSEEEEQQLKTYATTQDLLLMGPDCGTAIINGLPLGFANVVRRGKIAIIAASGTGLQEVSCRIHHLGEGISQALGTGGRDLHAQIDGQSMCQGIRMLAADSETQLIVLISKPPTASVAAKVLQQALECGKPVVVHFLGMAQQDLPDYPLTVATSLQHAADCAVALLRQQPVPQEVTVESQLLAQAMQHTQQMTLQQRDLRAVFAGGTFCYEAQLALLQQGYACSSNTPAPGAKPLNNPERSEGHALLDMGDDQFTQGRPHPMIDPALRNARLLQEACDPNCAVVLFDVVLGYGAATEPLAELLTVLQQAKQQQNPPLFIAHVCGTELDPQGRQQQISRLQQAGVLVADSNMAAALLAAQVIASRQGGAA